MESSQLSNTRLKDGRFKLPSNFELAPKPQPFRAIMGGQNCVIPATLNDELTYKLEQ